MNKCFVIQPFDDDKFDRRYDETFQPAIERAKLNPYRVDKDPSARILIDNIETNIKESAICFAEITTDNPNVWYELGFALACDKDIVMVCSSERKTPFPFDIRHRAIINYKTDSASDFKKLEEDITTKLLALNASAKTAETLNSTPVIDFEGLKSYEIALLIILFERTLFNEETLGIDIIKSEMNKSGYTDIATNVAAKTLGISGLINITKESRWSYNEEYFVAACFITKKGEEWILSNQDQLLFRKQNSTTKDSINPSLTDDLPF